MWSSPLQVVIYLGLLLVVRECYTPAVLRRQGRALVALRASTEFPRSSPPPVQPEDEADEEDRKLELQMAREQYDTLRGDSGPLLRTSQFLSWDEIVDVLDSGIIDRETMEIILKESGVAGEFMTFEQYFEVVDLVNEVSLALEEEEEGEDGEHEGNVVAGDDALNWLPQNDAEEEPAISQEALDAMLAAMGMRKRSAEPK